MVDGSEILPITPPATPSGTVTHTLATSASGKDEWYTKDTNVLAIITNCLELSQVSHIIALSTSKEAWDELCQLFELQDSVTKMYLREQQMILKMKDNESMIRHLHTFRILLDQLSAAGSPMSDEDVVLALVRSMLLSYKNFLISIQGQTLSLQTLITYLLQEEMMIKNLDNVIESSSFCSSALALRSNNPWNQQEYSKFSSRLYNTKNSLNYQYYQNNKNF